MNQTPLKYVILFTVLVALTVYFIMLNAATFRFHTVRDDFMDWHFANNPTSATWIGIHDYDGRLPDISAKGREKERVQLFEVKEKLEAIDGKSLNEIGRAHV